MTTEWMTEAALSTNDTGSAYKNLQQKGILVQIQGGVWSMETKLEANDVVLHKVPYFITLGKKRLLPV